MIAVVAQLTFVVTGLVLILGLQQLSNWGANSPYAGFAGAAKGVGFLTLAGIWTIGERCLGLQANSDGEKRGDEEQVVGQTFRERLNAVRAAAEEEARQQEEMAHGKFTSLSTEDQTQQVKEGDLRGRWMRIFSYVWPAAACDILDMVFTIGAIDFAGSSLFVVIFSSLTL